MVLNPVKGAFAIQIEAHAIKLIYPGRPTNWSVVAFMAECGANYDLPKANEEHK